MGLDPELDRIVGLIILFGPIFMLQAYGIHRANVELHKWRDGPKGSDGKVIYQWTMAGGRRVINLWSSDSFQRFMIEWGEIETDDLNRRNKH